MLFVGATNLMWTGYGQAFLDGVASIYPGYTGGATVGQVILATFYAAVDAAVAGAIFAWLYNRFA